MAKYILDISHHQPPNTIHYDKLSKELDFVIIRTQYGSKLVDKHYKTHHAEFKKRGVPRHAYAWVRGVSKSDMEKEATDFYNRTKEFEPEVYWLDVEEKSMTDMRGGVKVYAKKMRSLGVKKLGVYIAHHLYKDFNIDLSDFDAVWIPRYGLNKPDYPCDLWQYTEKGNLPGYSGTLDLNKLNGKKPLEWFTGADKKEVKPVAKQTKKVISLPDGILKQGSKGESVKQLKRALNAVYFKCGEENGIYDAKTKDAVRRFQMVHLPYEVDGVYGPNTKKKLQAALNK